MIGKGDKKEGENSNDDMLSFAQDMRDLIADIPGGPTIIAAMHPGKRPQGKDDLLPRGGSAFLNEVDGNLSIWTENRGKTSELHWTGKLRGVDFEPVSFKNVQTSKGGICDARGEPMVSVYAEPITAEEQEKIEADQQNNRNKVLTALHEAGPEGYSYGAICQSAGLINAAGKPKKSTAAFNVKKLMAEKLVEGNGNFYRLTQKGKRYVKEAGLQKSDWQKMDDDDDPKNTPKHADDDVPF